MKQLVFILIVVLGINFNLFAPNLSKEIAKQQKDYKVQLIKLNAWVSEIGTTYPFVDYSTTKFNDVEWLKKQVHKILLVEAISRVETGMSYSNYKALSISKKRKRAFNPKEGAVGITQIRWVMWYHLNKELKLVNFNLNDRWSAEKSYLMFAAFQDYYNPTWDIEQASRMWNGGHYGMKKTATLKYYKKVKFYYRTLKNQFNNQLNFTL